MDQQNYFLYPAKFQQNRSFRVYLILNYNILPVILSKSFK